MGLFRSRDGGTNWHKVNGGLADAWIDAIDGAGMYDAADGWFYDQLFDTSGARTPIEVQTLVGAIPVHIVGGKVKRLYSCAIAGLPGDTFAVRALQDISARRCQVRMAADIALP